MRARSRSSLPYRVLPYRKPPPSAVGNVAWGNFAEWVAGAGSIAAFGALLFAAQEWRKGQAEKRDREADQARLVIVVPQHAGQLPEKGVIWHTGGIVISNRSESPVFNLKIVWKEYEGESQSFSQPVLLPHSETELVRVSDPKRLAESITFFYTDVRGRPWARTGSQQPRLWTPTSG